MTGHLGIGATARRILKKYYHIRPYAMVRNFIARCVPCARKRQNPKSRIKNHRHTMLTHQASAPMEILYMDIFGPLPETGNHKKYILSVKEGFSKYCWFIPIENQESQTIAKKLEKYVFGYFGLCDVIVTDNQASLNSRTMKELYKKLNITRKPIVSYNPASNSVERVHSTLASIFRSLAPEYEGDNKWIDFVPAINLAVNSAKHRTTDFSPAFLFTGRSARLQRQLIFGEHEQEDRTREDHAVEVAERMKKVYKVVKENVAKHLEYRKKRIPRR